MIQLIEYQIVMLKNTFFFLFILSVYSCQDGSTSTSGVVQNVEVAEFKSLLDANPEKNLIDVRTDSEVANGMISGALQFDLSKMDFKESISKLDKSKPVFVYCAVGGRSSMASEVLEQAGFEKVYNLSGGINAWQAAGLPLGKLK